jgi:hypothetical protein
MKSQRYLLTKRINGRLHYLNSCDGWSIERRSARKLPRGEAEAALAQLRATERKKIGGGSNFAMEESK